MLTSSKPWWQSRAIWGGVIAATSGVAGLFGYGLTIADQAQIADSLTVMAGAVGAFIGGATAIYGRVVSDRSIG